jgi:hypothetical protein
VHRLLLTLFAVILVWGLLALPACRGDSQGGGGTPEWITPHGDDDSAPGDDDSTL